MTKAAYARYLRSPHWLRLRAKALEHAGAQCQQTWETRVVGSYWQVTRCPNRTRLEVHHVHYASIGRERLTDVRVLCRACHQATHRWREEAA